MKKKSIKETTAYQLAEIIGFNELYSIADHSDSIYVRIESPTPCILSLAGEHKAIKAMRAVGGCNIKLRRFRRHARRCRIAKEASTEGGDYVAAIYQVSRRTVFRAMEQVTHKDLLKFY